MAVSYDSHQLSMSRGLSKTCHNKKGLREKKRKRLPLIDQVDLIRTQQVLLVLTLAIYTEYSTKASYISKELLMY